MAELIRYYAQDIANYFLANVDEESGDNLTHLKLQKLVYYAQGLHLAMRREPLFREPIEAWPFGPVVPGLYHAYKHRRARAIEPPEHFDIDEYMPEVREILDAVSSAYGQFSAVKLMQMTHAEPPWRDTPLNHEISRSSLQRYFSEVVEAGRSGESIPGEPAWPTTSFVFQRRTEIMRRVPDRARLRAALDRNPSDP